ncbi:transposase [Rhizobium sp. 1AS11]|uniref:transposase n=1 Tax=Rhizobium acaciae TaxID=2989736 RepID=UPI002222EE21|nr:transposase [Rhizobium acaciae]MCW1413821.1 transposase [Rhizobium acaciae]MCW1745958.1 transposase [Rhizobium acaciae]
MADEENLEQPQPMTVTETESDGTAPASRKRGSSANGKSGAPLSRAKTMEPVSGKAKPRRYSDTERAEKLAQIETRASEGETLKAAIKEAGISEQTFYQWKRAAGAAMEPKAKAEASAVVDTLADLIALEEENKLLRIQLAEKLRAENAELRKRLGLD